MYFSDQTSEKFPQNIRRFLPDTKRTKTKSILASVASGFRLQKKFPTVEPNRSVAKEQLL